MSDVLNLNWGKFTPEFYNPDTNVMVHVFNHNIVGDENIIRVVRFCTGRIRWVQSYLEYDCKHEILFDDRGQPLNDVDRDIISETLSDYRVKVNFMSKVR